MKRRRFSAEQIITILKEAQAGVPVGELTRKHGIAEGTYYQWKAKLGGMEVSDARRLRVLEQEHQRLKTMSAEEVLDNDVWRAPMEAVAGSVQQIQHNRTLLDNCPKKGGRSALSHM